MMENTINNNKIDDIDQVLTQEKKQRQSNTELFAMILLISLVTAALFEYSTMAFIPAPDVMPEKKQIYCVHPYSNSTEHENGILKHVHRVLSRFGYERGTNESDWSLFWSWDYPFGKAFSEPLKPYQRVNHFPGTHHITLKVLLATSNLKHVPKAFHLPKQKEKFLDYAKQHKHAMFVIKNNNHRGVYLQNVSEMNLTSEHIFVQEYIQNPLLVDGHKFDIGIYVVLTSIDPLRVYWYKGDILIRYCPEKYHPFDSKNLDKYVVADNYLPTWEVPSLAYSHKVLGFGMKGSLDTYLKSKGKDPDVIWTRSVEAIREVFLQKEHALVEYLKQGGYSAVNLFEMVRFDLMVDEELNVHLVEANMSPNLVSQKFLPNHLLYEQILYNLFTLTGIARPPKKEKDEDSKLMVSAAKNIATWGAECSLSCKLNCDDSIVCALCHPCRTKQMNDNLLAAHTEFIHKGDFRRLYPPELKQGVRIEELLPTIRNLSESNKLNYMWYQGKCNDDVTWCN